MRTIRRTSLPKSIKYYGRGYTKNTNDFFDNPLGFGPGKHITVEVLSSKLKGKLNVHGKPYLPTLWIFTSVTELEKQIAALPVKKYNPITETRGYKKALKRAKTWIF